MPKTYVRIPLDVKPEFAVEIDRAVAKLMLATGERQTRTSFIQRAIRNEIDRMNAAEQSARGALKQPVTRSARQRQRGN